MKILNIHGYNGSCFNCSYNTLMELGFEVISLKRVQHGTITLEGMKKGQIKLIKPKQLKELKVYLNKIKKKAENA